MKKLAVIVTSAVVVAAGAIGYVVITKDDPQPTASTQQTQVEERTPEVSYQGVEGKNALELLKQSHTVKTQSYEGLGELVTSIDGAAADSKHFWALYVNDQQSQVGAGAYTTKNGDTLQWKLEEIQ